MRYLLALLAVSACSGDPGTVEITAEPVSAVKPDLRASKLEQAQPVPEEPTEILEAPPEPVPAAPIAPSPCLAGYHESGGACCLINVIPVGSCKCTEYDSSGKITVLGEQCFDSCALNDDGIAVAHSFCVPGGLTAEMRPK